MNEYHAGKTGRPDMKQMLLSFALLGVFGSVASANPLCTNNATYQSYITNFSTFANACQIGDKLFWGFQHTPGALAVGGEPLSNEITVHTSPGDGFSNIGIVFNSGGWVADSSTPIDDILMYQVATFSGAAIIKDATLTITGTLTGAGDNAHAVETLSPAVTGSPLTASLPSAASMNIQFLGNMQSSFLVKDEILLSVDSRNSTLAHISVVENDFSEAIPEPVSTVLIGSGLVLFGLAQRKRLKLAVVREPK
jgi:hypothetical protein